MLTPFYGRCIIHNMNNTLREPTSPRSMSRMLAIVVLLNAAISVGFAVATVVADPVGAGWYGADRAAVLFVAAVVIVIRRDARLLGLIGLVLTAVQLADGFVGLAAGDLSKTVGPFVIAALTFGGVLWTGLRSPGNPG